MGNHGDVLVDDSVDKSRVDKPRTLVEFVDNPRDVGELMEQALVELRTRTLVGFQPVVEAERALVEFAEAERALVEFADADGNGESGYKAEVLLQVPEGRVQAGRQLPVPSRGQEHAE